MSAKRLAVIQEDIFWKEYCFSNVPISINGALLPHVTSCRNLLTTVTSDLTPSVHVNNIIVKAHQSANAIHRRFVSRNIERLVRAYLVYVCPLLEYRLIHLYDHPILCMTYKPLNMSNVTLPSGFLVLAHTVMVSGYDCNSYLVLNSGA